MSRVRVFFDTVSPYAYIGVETLLRYRDAWRGLVSVELVPFLLGGVMKAAENKPPATVPFKAAYMVGDLRRLGRMHGVPLNGMPAVFPTNTLRAQRCLAVLQAQGRHAEMEHAARALWRAYWGGEGVDIGSEEGVRGVLEAALGGSEAAAKVLEAAGTAEAKKKLEANTTEAVAMGAFGAPWFAVYRAGETEPVCLWGSDRLELLCHELGMPYQGPMPHASKL